MVMVVHRIVRLSQDIIVLVDHHLPKILAAGICPLNWSSLNLVRVISRIKLF